MLEFGLFANDNSVERVSERLRFMVCSYFEELIAKKNIDQLYKDVQQTDLENFWAIYRVLSIERARKGLLEPENEVVFALKKCIKKINA